MCIRDRLEGSPKKTNLPSAQVEDTTGVDESKIHLPDLSYYPFFIGVGLSIAALGVLYSYALVTIGLILVFWGSIGWSTEPVNEPHEGAH